MSTICKSCNKEIVEDDPHRAVWRRMPGQVDVGHAIQEEGG